MGSKQQASNSRIGSHPPNRNWETRMLSPLMFAFQRRTGLREEHSWVRKLTKSLSSLQKDFYAREQMRKCFQLQVFKGKSSEKKKRVELFPFIFIGRIKALIFNFSLPLHMLSPWCHTTWRVHHHLK